MSMDFEKKPLPLGYEDFKEIIDEHLYYVDKTMLVYDIIRNKCKNNLITRPRRFGKTLNLSMLKYFLDITEKENAYLFDGLKVSEHYDELAQYRNTHPVISLSLKCGKQRNFELALNSICRDIQAQFSKYSFITGSEKLGEAEKKRFMMIVDAPE